MQRLILDANALLWWTENDPTLSREAQEAIVDPLNDVFVSAATVWEIAIKRALGKLRAPADMVAEIERQRLLELPVTAFHGESAGSLPPYHRDPFDRMLVAQAQCEGLTIVTRDRHIPLYGVRTLKA